MSSLSLIHLAPTDETKTGIASYANTVHDALTRFAGHRLTLTRVGEAEFIDGLNGFAPQSLIYADLGVNEGHVFRALMAQKAARPDLRRFILVHDPPRLVNSGYSFLEGWAQSFVGRAARRAFNLLFEQQMLRTFLLPNDQFGCLTSVGAAALQQKLMRVNAALSPVVHLPPMLYQEPPPELPSPAVGVPTVGYFGFISRDKGIDRLIDAAVSLHQNGQPVPRIEIRGRAAAPKDELYLSALRQQVIRAGLSDEITIGHFVPQLQLRSFLQSLTALALPYQSETLLSMSGPLMWAKTVGIPVIASRTQAIASLVEDGIEGVLVSPDDPAAWAAALGSVAQDPDRWQRLTQGTLVNRNRHRWQNVSAAYVKLFEQLASR